MVIRLGPTRHRELADGRRRTVAKLTVAGERSRVFFDVDGDVPFLDRNRGDLWVGPLMLLGMRLGEDVRLADPVSASRRARLRQVQRLLIRWFPDRLSRIRVRCPDPEPEAPPAAGTVSCFTGGVDSFATLLRCRDRVDALVYAGGLDIRLRHREHLARARAVVDETAASSGVRGYYVATNIKDPLRGHVRWRWESTSSVLASLGTLLSPVAGTLLIPATHTSGLSFGFGSHPRLDPLWSTDRLRVEHEGADIARSDRLRLIAGSPVARGNLRVCWQQREELNCGRCSKCLRTMAVLAAMGRLTDFPTFTRPLDLDLLSDVPVEDDNELALLGDARDFALRRPGTGALVAALDTAIGRYGAGPVVVS